MEPLSKDWEENLDRMVVQCLESGCVWGLSDADGNWALAPSCRNDEIDVMPFWSEKELAQKLCNGEWSVYSPTAIELEEFLDDWLPSMHSDLYMVGVNWDEELEGEEYEPLDLIEEFDADL